MARHQQVLKNVVNCFLVSNANRRFNVGKYYVINRIPCKCLLFFFTRKRGMARTRLVMFLCVFWSRLINLVSKDINMLLSMYHRLMQVHVISTFHWLNDVTVARKRLWRVVKKFKQNGHYFHVSTTIVGY